MNDFERVKSAPVAYFPSVRLSKCENNFNSKGEEQLGTFNTQFVVVS